jgi:hypothetical protein
MSSVAEQTRPPNPWPALSWNFHDRFTLRQQSELRSRSGVRWLHAFDQTKMNTVRKILLVPIYISVAVLAVCAYLGPRALSVDYPAPYSKKAVEWHAAAMKSNDPEILRDHADKLWVALNDSDKTVGTFVKATRSGLIAASIASFALLVFSVAAFIKAKGKDRTIPSSKSSQGSTADG